MQILHKLCPFQVSRQDLTEIYVLYIRSTLELNCHVWHFSLTDEERTNLERVQKVACRLILKDDYQHYNHALKELNLQNLNDRRYNLCVKFAQKCTKHPKAAKMFPLNKVSTYNLRQPEKFYVQPAHTSRLRDSAIPQMQRALNAAASRSS